MLRNNRIIQLSGSTYTDHSKNLSEVHGTSSVINMQAGDKLFLGSDFPFNHKYFDLKVFNDQAATMVIELWSGNIWVPVVDIMDETAVAGIPFSQSGIISWQPNLDTTSWSYDDTDEMGGSGLEDGPKIFKLYWLRMSFNVALKTTLESYYVGHRFSADPALESEYPELGDSRNLTAWKSGKTDWKEQSLVAAEYIIQDLRGMKDLIISPSQILDWNIFEKASVHKTAEIVFRGMGDDYQDQKLDAMVNYKKALSVGKFNIDQDMDASLSDGEKRTNHLYGTR